MESGGGGGKGSRTGAGVKERRKKKKKREAFLTQLAMLVYFVAVWIYKWI